MNNSLLLMSFCAVLVFWGVGAYNRLVRLRAMAIAAFAPLHLQYEQYAPLVQNNFSPSLGEDQIAPRTGLLGAALQFEISLKAAYTQPLDSLVMRALETAHDVLHEAWTKVCCEQQDLAGELGPNTMQKQWLHIALQARHAMDEYKRRIQDYNRGIQQFPASLLAWLFRFKTTYWEDDAAC